MSHENIHVELVTHKPTLKKQTGFYEPPPLQMRLRVMNGPEKTDIQILHRDSSGREIFSTIEAVEIAQQFLEQNPNPQPIPAMAKERSSKYVLYTIGEKTIYVFIAWTHGLDIMIMLPTNKQLEPIRTDDSTQIPSFGEYNPS